MTTTAQAMVTTEPKALAPTESVGMFERMAKDPSVDVDKFERFMAMYERAQAKVAEDAFNAAMSATQNEMRRVAPDAYNPQTKSKYPTHGKLDAVLRPIYTSHGFALSYNTTEGAPADWVRLVCKVTHAGGHKEVYHLDMPADGKGAKGGDVMTKTHAVGAAMSYGMRYLLKMVFNVAVGEEDRDGNVPTEKELAPMPKGFQDAWDDLVACADNGTNALEKAWTACNGVFKTYVMDAKRKDWNDLKAKAAKVRQ